MHRIFAAAVAAGSLALAGGAAACSCVWTIEEAILNADQIYSGVALDVEERVDDVLVTFEVRDIWAGPPTDTRQVVVPPKIDSCHLNFEVGTSYVVLAKSLGEIPETNPCWFTGTVAGSADAIKVLGDPFPPVDDRSWSRLKSLYR